MKLLSVLVNSLQFNFKLNSIMFSIVKSKKYQVAHTLLKNSGFFQADFKMFRLKEIINAIVEDSSLLVSLIEVIK